MWFYRQPLVSVKGEAKMNLNGSISRNDFNNLPEAERDEILFEHEGMMKIFFKASSSDYITI